MSTMKSLRAAARNLGTSIGERFFHAAQCGYCPICDQQIDLELHKTSYDHVWPLNGQDGSRNLHHGNLLLVHSNCNNTKGNRQPTKGELSVLSMVNNILGFNHADGQYARMATKLKSFREYRLSVESEIATLKKRFETVDRQIHCLEMLKLNTLQGNLDVIDEMIEDQLQVFTTYEFLDD